MRDGPQAKHTVYRAIEGWAHGVPGLLALEWAVIGCIVFGCFVVTASIASAASAPIGGAVLVSLLSLCFAVALLFLLRRHYDGRREAVHLMLLRRKRSRRRHRILDVDAQYRPYQSHKHLEVDGDPTAVLDRR